MVFCFHPWENEWTWSNPIWWYNMFQMGGGKPTTSLQSSLCWLPKACKTVSKSSKKGTQSTYLQVDPPKVSNFSPWVCFWWLGGTNFTPLEDSGTYFTVIQFSPTTASVFAPRLLSDDLSLLRMDARLKEGGESPRRNGGRSGRVIWVVTSISSC